MKLDDMDNFTESLVNLIGASPRGTISETIDCRTTPGRTKDDRPFCWKYKSSGLVYEEWGNDSDEPEEEDMADRAGRHLLYYVAKKSSLIASYKKTSTNDATFQVSME